MNFHFICSPLLALTSSLLMLFSGSLCASDAPLEIGSRRELFVDRFLVERLNNVHLKLHEPRDEGEVLRFDQPWEGPFCGYSTIIKDGELFRLYYRGKQANKRMAKLSLPVTLKVATGLLN